MCQAGKEGDVNNELKDARIRAGLTQAQVAKIAGVSTLMYQRYEYGTSDPTVKVAIRIADALGVDVKELFGEVESSD